MNDLNNEHFIKVVRFIYDNIDQLIMLEDLAELIGVSVSSLKRLFVEVTGQSPGIFIRRIRMEFAFQSLQSRKDSILSHWAQDLKTNPLLHVVLKKHSGTHHVKPEKN